MMNFFPLLFLLINLYSVFPCLFTSPISYNTKFRGTKGSLGLWFVQIGKEQDNSNDHPFIYYERETNKNLIALNSYDYRFKNYRNFAKCVIYPFSFTNKPLWRNQFNLYKHLTIPSPLFYSTEQTFFTSDPRFQCEILDIIKLFGRLSEEKDKLGCINIAYCPLISSSFPTNTTENETFHDFNHPTSSVKEKDHISSPKKNLHFTKASSFYPKWKFLFFEKDCLDKNEFTEAIYRLPFKWPEPTRFPFYFVYLYEHGYKRGEDSIELREAINKNIQGEAIAKIAVDALFNAFSENSKTVNHDSIIKCLEKWNLGTDFLKSSSHTVKSSLLQIFKSKLRDIFLLNRHIHPIINFDWKSFLNMIDENLSVLHS